MKKLLACILTVILALACLTACDLFEKDKNVTCEKYENCAVFTFDDFPMRNTASFKLERKGLGEGAIYYQVNLEEGALSVSYKDTVIHVVQPLGEFTADDEMPINGSGGYIEGDKITITFESDSPVSGEIIIAFTEDALKAVHTDKSLHEHTIEWDTNEETHKRIYTCCPEYTDTESPHYDDDENGICDECGYEAELIFKLIYEGTGYELDRVGPGYRGGDIVIPSEYKGLPVVEIGYGAFKSDYKLTSVVIPDSVTLIDDDAFENQTSLTSVNAGKNVVTIGVSAFEGCTKLKTVVISDATEYIYASAFEGCTALETVDLGKNVKEITGSVFENCTCLKTIRVPASIEKMGAWVFLNAGITDIYFGVSAPGENWNEKWAEGLNESVNIHWNENATNTGKVQTTISEEAQLPQFMSLEVDKYNTLSNNNAISVDCYMGYVILNKDGAAFSDIVVPEEDFENYTFVLEINYNNETREVAIENLNYFEKYECDMDQGVVCYSKYNTIQFDTDKMMGKSYGFVNIELYMISNTNQRYFVSAQTLYYSVTESEIVFGLVSNPVATEGDPGIITKGWEYSEN